MAETKKRVLFVDDEPNVLQAFRRLLRDQRQEWEMTFVDSPLSALELLRASPYDAVVSDVRMPQMSGIQLLERLQQAEATKDIPVVIVTGEADRRLKSRALGLGAADLLNKPVDREDLLARLKSVLRLKSHQDELKAYSALLEQKVRERTRELELSRFDIIWRLAKAGECRDEDTGNHVIRVACYSRSVAEALGMDHEFVETISLAAPLHDIGKIGIPDAVLRKPGKLTDEEWLVMRGHCAVGAAILQDDSKVLKAFVERWGGLCDDGRDAHLHNPLLKMASSIALSHHERWDGTGYPRNLAGEEIPLEARVVTIADVYDALRSPRPYKPAFSEEKALAILADGAGAHFDPSVFAAFAESLDTIRDVDRRLSDQQRPGTTEEVENDQYSLCR